MKTSTIVLVVLGVGLVGVGGYMLLSKPAAPPAKTAANPAAPSGYAAGGNSTLNTVSQVVGVGQQAAQLFGSVSSAVSTIES